MTKQHFEMVARVLRDRTLHLTDAKRRALASRFADEFAAVNPRFDRDRFTAACMGEDATDSAGRTVHYGRA